MRLYGWGRHRKAVSSPSATIVNDEDRLRVSDIQPYKYAGKGRNYLS